MNTTTGPIKHPLSSSVADTRILARFNARVRAINQALTQSGTLGMV